MNETNAVHLTQEKHPALQQVSSEDPDSASIQEERLQAIEVTASTGARDGQEAYEQGMGLKTVGLFRQAAEHFEKAGEAPQYRRVAMRIESLSMRRTRRENR